MFRLLEHIACRRWSMSPVLLAAYAWCVCAALLRVQAGGAGSVTASEQCSAAASAYNGSWTLPVEGAVGSLAGSAVDCSLVCLECLGPADDKCSSASMLVLSRADGTVLLNHSHGLNDTHRLLEQSRSPAQVVSGTDSAAYVTYLVGDRQQQCAGSQVTRISWTSSGAQQLWSRRLCKRLTQPRGASDAHWAAVPVTTADGDASEWVVHIDQSLGDDSLNPPPHSFQWAIYDGVHGSVRWTGNSTLQVGDLWFIFSNSTTSAFAVVYGLNGAIHQAFYAIDTRTASVRLVRDASSDWGNSSSGSAQWELQQAGQAILYRKSPDERLSSSAVQWRAVDALSGTELWHHENDPLLNGDGWAAQWQHLNYSFLTQMLPTSLYRQVRVPALGDDSHYLLLNVASAIAHRTEASASAAGKPRQRIPQRRPRRDTHAEQQLRCCPQLAVSPPGWPATASLQAEQPPCICYLMQLVDFDVRSGKAAALSAVVGPLVQGGANSTDLFFPTLDVTLNGKLVVTALGEYWVFDRRTLTLQASGNITERVQHLFDRSILLASLDHTGRSDAHLVATSTDRRAASVSLVTQP